MKANPEPKTQNHKGDATKTLPSKETATKPRRPPSSKTGGGKPAKAITLSGQEKVAPRDKYTKKMNGEAEGRDEQKPAKREEKGGRDGHQPAKRKNKGWRDGQQPAKKAKATPEPQPPTE